MSKTTNEVEKVKVELCEEQKKYAAKIESYKNDIAELEQKNVVLEKEAEKFDKLASTIDTEPFVELKGLVKETIKTYTDREDVKEVKKKIKNFEAITSMENLLNEYKDLADENRQNIIANNYEIENYNEKIKELDEKITNYQVKLDLGDNTETECTDVTSV